jgi:hypothetical protein
VPTIGDQSVFIVGQKFDMGAETLTVLNKQTSVQGDNLGALIRQLS